MHACIHCITLHCIALHGMALHCIAYIALHYTTTLHALHTLPTLHQLHKPYIYIYIYIIYINLQEIHKLHTTYTLQAYCTLHAPHHITSNWKYYITLRHVTLHYVTLRYINIYKLYCIALYRIAYIHTTYHTHTPVFSAFRPDLAGRPVDVLAWERLADFQDFFIGSLIAPGWGRNVGYPKYYDFLWAHMFFQVHVKRHFYRFMGSKSNQQALVMGERNLDVFLSGLHVAITRCVLGMWHLFRNQRRPFCPRWHMPRPNLSCRGCKQVQDLKGLKVFTTRAISCINHAI
jgi:hypothetical protein